MKFSLKINIMFPILFGNWNWFCFVSSICAERENDDVEKTGLQQTPSWRLGQDKTRRDKTRQDRTCTCTFSIKSMQANKSIPKSIKSQWIPSFLYSSCSRTNMWWLKNCCSFSLVKLMQSCSKPLNCKG